MEHNFKVGDLVIGNAYANSRYIVTKKGWKGQVVRLINSHRMEVQNNPDGAKFSVYCEYFDLVKAAEPSEPTYQIY